MKPLCAVVAAVFASLVLLVAGAPPASAVDVTYFKGSITDVGVQREAGGTGGVEHRMELRFFYDGPIDLSRSTMVLQELFVEEGGAGELMTMADDVNFLPFILVTNESSEVDEAKYESPSRFRPQIRVQVENDEGEFEVKYKLDRGLMRQRPQLCVFDEIARKSFTFMTHSFTISDGINPPVVFSTKQRWECTKEGRYHMRAR